MAKVRQRAWRIPGQRTKRKAWGFVTVAKGEHRRTCSGAPCSGCKQVRIFRTEWTEDDASQALAAHLLKIEPAKPSACSMTFGQAVERYVATKARKRTVAEDKRILAHLRTELGADTPLSAITANRISEYKAKRLAAVRKIGDGNNAKERLLTPAAVNRPLALLRHLLRLAHEEWGVLDEGAPRIRTEKEPQGRLRWLTEEEATKLLAVCRKSKNKALPGLAPVRWTVNCFRDRHCTLSEGGTEIAPPVPIIDPEGTVRSRVTRDRS